MNQISVGLASIGIKRYRTTIQTKQSLRGNGLQDSERDRHFKFFFPGQLNSQSKFN